jgi:hypothetical protein
MEMPEYVYGFLLSQSKARGNATEEANPQWAVHISMGFSTNLLSPQKIFKYNEIWGFPLIFVKFITFFNIYFLKKQ